MKRWLSILITFVFLSGCQEYRYPYSVDAEFADAVEIFKAEAAARGVKLTKPDKNMVVRFEESPLQSTYLVRESRPGRILIVIRRKEWFNEWTEREQDFVVWHALLEGFLNYQGSPFYLQKDRNGVKYADFYDQAQVEFWDNAFRAGDPTALNTFLIEAGWYD